MTASSPPMRAVLAVDLGGTAMKGAVVDEAGREHAHRSIDTPNHDVIGVLTGLVGELARAARRDGLDPVGAAVVTPGSVDEAQGVVRYASNLGWQDFPLLDLLHSALAMPVAVGHDVRAAGLAERLFGAGHGAEDFVLVPIGTGVAAALFSGGDAVTGAMGAAGEFGHIPIVLNGETCRCGQRGCLEVYVSGAGVARRYTAAAGASLSSREIAGRLGSDPVADRVWEEATDVLAQGLAILTLLVDPSVIVLGGGFSRAGDALMRPVRDKLASGLAWRAAPPVVVSELADNAGCVGAAILAFRAAGLGHLVDSWTVTDLGP